MSRLLLAVALVTAVSCASRPLPPPTPAPILPFDAGAPSSLPLEQGR